MKLFYIYSQIFLLTLFLSRVSAESLCGNWETYKDEKCIKIFDVSKFFTFEDAEKSCNEAENGSSVLTIHSDEEQAFVSEFLFKTQKIVDNIWLGLKSTNKQFKWTDSSELRYTNWATGSPSNKTDFDCAQMVPESTPPGKWSDEPCNKKSLVVCQKSPSVSISFLQNTLLETRRQLNDTRKQFNTFLSNFLSDKWINYKLFTDTDGKHKAFFIPFDESGEIKRFEWEEAEKVCSKFNATIVEIQSLHKQRVFEIFLGQLGYESNRLTAFWLNGRRDSSGKWKWINSGKEFTHTQWDANYPSSSSGSDFLYILFNNSSTFGQWHNNVKIAEIFVACEHEINFNLI